MILLRSFRCIQRNAARSSLLTPSLSSTRLTLRRTAPLVSRGLSGNVQEFPIPKKDTQIGHPDNLKAPGREVSSPEDTVSMDLEKCENPDELQKELDELLAMSKTGEKIGIRNQILFALGFSGLAFTIAAIQANLTTLELADAIAASGRNPNEITKKDILDAEMSRHRTEVDNLHKQLVLDEKNDLGLLFNPALDNVMSSLKSSFTIERLAYAMGAINVAVYLAWNSPRIRIRGIVLDPKVLLSRTFVQQCLSGKSYTMLTSTFSHQGIIHLGFNTFALVGFATGSWVYLNLRPQLAQFKPLASLVNPTQTEELSDVISVSHACAFLLSAGVVSSLGTHMYLAKLSWPRCLAQFRRRIAFLRQPDYAKQLAGRSINKVYPIIPVIPNSLGMSGAIFAGIALTTFIAQDEKVRLLFLPQLELPLKYASVGFVVFDVLGLIFWTSSTIGHAAHLSGMLFGCVYYQVGPSCWMVLRRTVQPMSDWIHRRSITGH